MSNPVSKELNNQAFGLVLKWSGVMLVVAILFGLMYRLINPVELHLDEEEYIEKVFVEEETQAWSQPAGDSTLIGTYDAGSILYVIDEQDDFLMVRPFIVSKVDSVWISTEDTTHYSQPVYEQWLYEQERRRYGLE